MMLFEKHHQMKPESTWRIPNATTKRAKTAWSLALLACVAMASGAAYAVKEVADAKISQAVDTELIIDEAVEANHIDVSTTEGIVSLTGTVGNLLAKERATKIAEATVGVRAVVNTMTVVPTVTMTDAELTRSVEDALLADSATEVYEVDASVKAGKVTLEGMVDSWQERQLAATVAKNVTGVTALKNNVTVAYKTDRADFEIQEEIKGRMQSDVRVDDYLVDVAVKDGDVTLTGTVGSAAEKRQCRKDAWVAGTKTVDASDLKVEWWARDDMRRKKSYGTMSDAQIAEAVRDAFVYDPRVLSFNPEVAVDAGTVTLSGVVDNLQAKRAAERDARNVHGVWSVNNNIKVRTEITREDPDIEKSVSNTLLRDPYVERFDVTVDATKGWVTLEGEVNTSFEKRRAELLAESVSGVLGVFNRVDFEHEWSWQPDREIEDSVDSQLTWSPFVDADDIEVSVDDGMVTLAGNVGTWAERQSATENAFEGGAKGVDNNLSVTYEGYGPYEYHETMGWIPPVF